MSGAVVAEALTAMRAAHDTLAAADFDALNHAELLAAMDEFEALSCALPSVGHRMLAGLQIETSALGLEAKQRLFLLDQDGPEPDYRERQRRRGITVGKQGRDGMSKVSGWLTPEMRATWEAIFAKFAAPGMCNPDDPQPCVGGTPSQNQPPAPPRTPHPPRRHHPTTLVEAPTRSVETPTGRTGPRLRPLVIPRPHRHLTTPCIRR